MTQGMRVRGKDCSLPGLDHAGRNLFNLFAEPAQITAGRQLSQTFLLQERLQSFWMFQKLGVSFGVDDNRHDALLPQLKNHFLSVLWHFLAGKLQQHVAAALIREQNIIFLQGFQQLAIDPNFLTWKNR